MVSLNKQNSLYTNHQIQNFTGIASIELDWNTFRTRNFVFESILIKDQSDYLLQENLWTGIFTIKVFDNYADTTVSVITVSSVSPIKYFTIFIFGLLI